MSIYLGKTKIANVGSGGGDISWSGTRAEYDSLVNSGSIDVSRTYYLIDEQCVYSGYDLVANVNDIDPSDIINDTAPVTDKVYSSKKTEERLQEVENSITGGGVDTAKMWQKTYLNVNAGDSLYINTTGDYIMDKAIIQPYKFIEGEQGIVETLKTFDNSEADNFYYNEENVVFDGAMKIKDEYDLNFTYDAENGYYESNVINKSDYIDLYGIGVG